jgi:hypothetical protein
MFTVRILVLLAVSIGAGLLNAVVFKKRDLVPDLREIHEHQAWQKSVGVELADFLADARGGGVIIIDARAAEEFRHSRLDVPLILNLPEGAATASPEIADQLRLVGLPVVIYCASATCDAAENVFHELRELGFSGDLRIYFAGWKGIEDTRTPITSAPPPDLAWLLGASTTTDAPDADSSEEMDERDSVPDDTGADGESDTGNDDEGDPDPDDEEQR